MSETKYTVFTENCWQDSDPECGAGVADLIDWMVADGWEPVAWCEGSASGRVDDARRESIAAGRVIELVDGKYVARGMTPTLDKLEAEKELDRVIARIDATPTYWARNNPKDAAMIARDAKSKTTPRHLVKAILEDLATPISKVGSFDPFPDFIVNSGTTSVDAQPSHPLTRMSAGDHRFGRFSDR